MRRILGRVRGWDLALTARLTLPAASEGSRAWRRLASGIAHSGDSGLWLFGAALARWRGKGRWSEGGRRVLRATLLGGGMTWLFKQLFRRRRPTAEAQGLYLSLDLHSFPSGHAGRNACVVVSLLPLLSWPSRVGMLSWLGLMGLSRVALGVHYVSDVLAGFLIGGSIGWRMRKVDN